MQKDFARCI